MLLEKNLDTLDILTTDWLFFSIFSENPCYIRWCPTASVQSFNFHMVSIYVMIFGHIIKAKSNCLLNDCNIDLVYTVSVCHLSAGLFAHRPNLDLNFMRNIATYK